MASVPSPGRRDQARGRPQQGLSSGTSGYPDPGQGPGEEPELYRQDHSGKKVRGKGHLEAQVEAGEGVEESGELAWTLISLLGPQSPRAAPTCEEAGELVFSV